MAQKTILLVDDEPNLVILVESLLKPDYKVISASNGVQALEILETLKPDLVILDMMMPYMSGREICEKIRKNPQTKDLKVVFLTIVTFSDIGKNELDKLKVLDYIAKPFDINDFTARIKKAINA